MDNDLLEIHDGNVSFTKSLNREEIRENIISLHKLMDSMTHSKIELKTEHMFSTGMYARILHIPKGTLLVGKIHKQECINIVSKGDISILTETGSARVSAGFHIVSPPGLQKVGYAHEDTIFTNVFLTDKTDLDLLEKELIFDSYENIPLSIEQSLQEWSPLCLG